MNKVAIAVHLLLKVGGRVNNKSLNKVIDGLIEEKDQFNKSLPMSIKIRYGMVSGKEVR